ncbi:MAG: hypothetical protein WBA59_03715 [Moheibacter sp.]
MKIKKAKIKNHLFLQYECRQTVDGVTNDINTSSDAPIHEDLKNAFLNLVPHFAFLADEFPEKQMKKFINGQLSEDDEVFRKFKVGSFIMGGNGDSEGVTISGSKEVEMGVISFSTPFIKYDGDYQFIVELIGAMEILEKEVKGYIEGKRAPKAQTELNFDDFDENEFEHAEQEAV